MYDWVDMRGAFCKHYEHGRIKLYVRRFPYFWRKKIYQACAGCGEPIIWYNPEKQ
jgi:hypothetical protein